jgi:hypothetical protein
MGLVSSAHPTLVPVLQHRLLVRDQTPAGLDNGRWLDSLCSAVGPSHESTHSWAVCEDPTVAQYPWQHAVTPVYNPNNNKPSISLAFTPGIDANCHVVLHPEAYAIPIVTPQELGHTDWSHSYNTGQQLVTYGMAILALLPQLELVSQHTRRRSMVAALTQYAISLGNGSTQWRMRLGQLSVHLQQVLIDAVGHLPGVEQSATNYTEVIQLPDAGRPSSPLTATIHHVKTCLQALQSAVVSLYIFRQLPDAPDSRQPVVDLIGQLLYDMAYHAKKAERCAQLVPAQIEERILAWRTIESRREEREDRRDPQETTNNYKEGRRAHSGRGW